MFWNNTAVNLIKEIDTAKAWWCSSAVMFSVKNGRNTICGIDGPENDDYEHSSQLQLNGKALVQSRLPMCPTCAGMLATGYGIENIDCPELKAARGCMNSEYTGIWDTAEKIKPHMHLIENAKQAMLEVGITPLVQPIRGGTDGCRLSYEGIPCPNLFTGAYNFHSRYEYVAAEEMEAGAEVLLRILNKYAAYELDT